MKGGKREGAGRKPAEPTVVVSIRLKESVYNMLPSCINRYINSLIETDLMHTDMEHYLRTVIIGREKYEVSLPDKSSLKCEKCFSPRETRNYEIVKGISQFSLKKEGSARIDDEMDAAAKIGLYEIIFEHTPSEMVSIIG